MKNREKIFIIFTIAIVVLTILFVVRGNIEINNMKSELEILDQEVGNGEIVKDKYTDRIEEEMSRYMFDIANYNARFTALSLYISEVMQEYMVEYAEVYRPFTGMISLVFYSFSITLFVYFMITIEYKNKKQYFFANLGIFIIAMSLFGIEKLAENIWYTNLYNTGVTLLPLAYLTFLTGNAIKNKRKLTIFNAIILDLIVIVDAIYNIMIWQFWITWNLVFGVFLILLAIEGIIIFINKLTSKNNKMEVTNEK